MVSHQLIIRLTTDRHDYSMMVTTDMMTPISFAFSTGLFVITNRLNGSNPCVFNYNCYTSCFAMVRSCISNIDQTLALGDCGK